MTKYLVQGEGEIELTQQNFVAAGGEGDIFKKNKTAYKIYHDPQKMMPIGKMQELSVLTLPSIIRPEKPILNIKSHVPTGYTMRLISGTSLCQLFTKAFRQRNNISSDQIIHLIKELQKIIAFIHSKGILVVDLNENNFLASDKFDEIYAIDVNSYKTKSYPATVIVPSVYDRHCKNVFNEGTDWFSWGIVTFQMLLGIHPYKGNHPDFESIPKDDRMDARMMKNVSVFHDKVSIPKICPPLDIIPPALRAWYIEVFEKGIRMAPPTDFEATHVATVIKRIAGSNLFEIQELVKFPSEIFRFTSLNGNTVVFLDKQVIFNGRAYSVPCNNFEAIVTPKNRLFITYLEQGEMKVYDVQDQKMVPFTCNAKSLMGYAGRVYAQSGSNIFELNVLEFGNAVKCSLQQVANVLDVPDASKSFDGVIVQNLLGRFFFSMFVGRSHTQIKIPELDKYKMVEAKFINKVLVVVGLNHKTKNYDRFVFRLSPDMTSYDVRRVDNVSLVGINFAVTDAGVCVLMNEEENLEVFFNKKDSPVLKIMNDPAINSDDKLFSDGAKMLFARQGILHSFSIRSQASP